MEISSKERYEFYEEYVAMSKHIRFTTHIIPQNLDILLAILVMKKEDPSKLIELVRLMKEEKK